MKKNAMIKNYEKLIEARNLKVEKQILDDSLTNHLLKRAGDVPQFYKYWTEEAKLVAVLNARESNDPKAQSYYSVGSLQNGEAQNQIRLSPVFMYINEHFEDLTQKTINENNKFFTFDSENNQLYSYEKKPHSQSYHYVKRQNFEEMKNYLIENPVVLFFYGCDDGSVGKRFKTEQEAFEYLQLIEVFEDIFDKDLQYYN